MPSWLIMLGGLWVWALHFFALYAIGEFMDEETRARPWVVALTLVALIADGILIAVILKQTPADTFERWRRSIAATAAALSGLAVLWQGLPALI